MSLADGSSWASLLPDIIKHSLNAYLASVNAIRTSRLVCRHWRDSILLPAVVLDNRPYSKFWQHLYPGDIIKSPDLDPIPIFKLSKTLKAAALGLERHIFPAPKMLLDISQLRNIATLDLSENHIDEPLINLLPVTKSIKTLILARAHFKSARHCWEFFDKLKLNRTIQTLNLSNTFVFHSSHERTIDGLVGCASLTSLNVSENGNEPYKFDLLLCYAEILSRSAGIQVLNVSNNPISGNSEASIDAFSKALETTSTLISLDMSKCMFGSKEELAVLQAIRRNTTLKSISFLGVTVSESNLRTLANSIGEHPKINRASLPSLALGCHLLDSTTLRHMLKANRIHSIVIQSFDLTLHDVKAIFDCPSLTSVNLSMSDLGHACETDSNNYPLSRTIAEHPNLRRLVLRKCSLPGFFVKRLCSRWEDCQPLLQMLNLGVNSLGTEEAECLGRLITKKNSITFLDVSSNLFGSEGAFRFAKHLKHSRSLLRLHMRSSHFQRDDALSIIDAAVQSELLELDLRNNCLMSSAEAARIGGAANKPSLDIIFSLT
jgi:Ran GTPase-activating protein (RanGAP) involved in mRNA processing and transport